MLGFALTPTTFFSKCLLSLLLLKELQDGATLESAHLELQDDACLVIVNFYTATSSLSHGDLDFDPRSDLSEGGGGDAEHPMDITMSRIPSLRDTFNFYFNHTKVNSILNACLLSFLEDGILLDRPTMCPYRFDPDDERAMEEVNHKRAPTPSAREAWKQRRKKTVQNLHYRTVRSIQRAVLVCGENALPDSSTPQADSPVVQFLDAQKFLFPPDCPVPLPDCPVVHLRAEFGQGPCNFTLSPSLTPSLPWTYMHPSFSSILG